MKNYRRTVLQCLVVAGLFAVLHGVSAANPMKDISHIDAFAFGGIGAAGIPSNGEIAFREIMARSDALKDFHKLLKSGNAEVKCYALVGIRKLEPKAFPGLAAEFKDDQTKVKTIGGCIIMELPMGAVVAGIAKGNYDASVDRKLNP